ncbi:DsbA family protein [Saccharobesus litoralis]|uniref:DsbA family protein n=1 Tax=Saccharobesus litoralis TaxID=2172099 RepID=A0A2S0VMP5_9ALTE|nr:DsbA family protein [Saccharobesus litoralis]AWB65475.1 DsbA family protein [Saccharobesus litoralis]
MQLVYVMDPMCAWCYAFQPELEGFLQQHPTAEVDWVMGGLAPDTDQPMPEHLQQTIATYWQQIESKTKVTFNHDFWALNTPYRSTYPACRAVIAAQTIKAQSAQSMVKAIQSAYYQQALNPSLPQTLVECAVHIGLDKQAFTEVFQSSTTEQNLQLHLGLSLQLQVSGFPALFYIDQDNRALPLTLGYSTTASLQGQLSSILS